MGKIRNTISLQEKAQALELLSNGVKQKTVAEQLKIKESSLSKWKKNKVKILKAAEDEVKMGLKSKKSLRQPKFLKVHIALYIWLVQERRKKKFVTDLKLQTMASKFKLAFYENPEPVSMGFIQHFKQSRNLKRIKSSGEKRAANKEAVNPYKIHFKQLVENLGLSLEQLYNADESALLYRDIPESSICLPNENSADVEGKKVLHIKLLQ